MACGGQSVQPGQQTPNGTFTETVTGTTRTEVIHLTTADGVKLSGTVYHPDASNIQPNSILLLHEAYRDSQVWDQFARAAQERGYTVLALDLRGHGQSAGEISYTPALDNDVEAALSWLRSTPAIENNQTSIIGASIGASLALRAGVRHPEIKSVILLSPGIQLWELGIADAVIDYGNRPLLLVAAEDDRYPFSSVNQLYNPANDNHQVEIYPGAEHGTALLERHPELTPLLLDWIR